MNKIENYRYTIPDQTGTTAILITTTSDGVKIKISRSVETTSCTEIVITDKTVIETIRAVMERKE